MTEIDLTRALTALITLLHDLTFLPFAVGFVVAATALLKRVIPPRISAGAIALTVQVGVWVAYVVAGKFGYGASFESTLQAVTQILSAVTMIVLGSGVTSATYATLKRSDTPFFGAER